jgi:hypothetical protein
MGNTPTTISGIIQATDSPEQQPQQTPKRDYLKVLGPDNRHYRFPTGTSKDQVINYFKTKGITSPESKAPAKAQEPPKAPPQTPAPPPQQTPQARQAEESYKQIESMPRPRWDRPEEILKDPTWYGRSARYLGGEAIGATKGAATMAVGGVKILHDVANALDPFYGKDHPYEAQKQVGRDVVDVGKGIIDLGKMTWDMLRHLDTANADPEKFGNNIAQLAATVDGAAKFASEVAPTFKGAVQSTIQTAKSSADTLIHTQAIEDAYIHKGGVDIAKNEVQKAVQTAQKEVEVHAQNLVQKIGKLPEVDATGTALDIINKFNDTVKTAYGQGARGPVGMDNPHPLIMDMINDAQNTAPGMWTWEKAKQLRSKVGRVLGSGVAGPMQAVLSEAYGKLTQELGGVARKYGLGDSWKAYNELEEDIRTSFPIIDKAQALIEGKEPGASMASALKDESAAQEVVDSLKPYGLDGKKVMTYAKLANKILRERGNLMKSLFQHLYRLTPATPFAVPAAMLAKELAPPGTQFLASVAAATLVGAPINHLVRVVRAMKLEPQILQHILLDRKWREPTPVPKGRGIPQPPGQGPGMPPGLPAPGAGGGGGPFQAGPAVSGTPQLGGAPSPTPTGPPQMGAPRAALPAPRPAMLGAGAPELPLAATPEVAKVQRIAEDARGREAGARPGTTKETKLARAAKQRERVAAVRAEKGSTALGGGGKEVTGGGAAEAALAAREAVEAQQRVAAPHLNISNMQIPELEETLKGLDAKMLKDMQGLRKDGTIHDSDYHEWLKQAVIEAYEDKINESSAH